MPRGEALGHACVEVTAALSTASVAAGRLAVLGADETIEITPNGATGAIVMLMAGGKAIARARLRNADNRLIATIIELGDTSERPLDEWRFIKKNSSV
jgi:hypothetical protein